MSNLAAVHGESFDFAVPKIVSYGEGAVYLVCGKDLNLLFRNNGDLRVSIYTNKGKRLWKIFINEGHVSGGPYKKRLPKAAAEEDTSKVDADKLQDRSKVDFLAVFDGNLTEVKKTTNSFEFSEVMFRAYENIKDKTRITQASFICRSLAAIEKNCPDIPNCKEIIEAEVKAHKKIEKPLSEITVGDIVGEKDAFWVRYRKWKKENEAKK
jgi:hypothetical protein